MNRLACCDQFGNIYLVIEHRKELFALDISEKFQLLWSCWASYFRFPWVSPYPDAVNFLTLSMQSWCLSSKIKRSIGTSGTLKSMWRLSITTCVRGILGKSGSCETLNYFLCFLLNVQFSSIVRAPWLASENRPYFIYDVTFWLGTFAPDTVKICFRTICSCNNNR